MRKANNQNRFIRLITLPIRVLTKARDLYVKSMINYAATASYGANGMGIGSGQVSSLDSLPKSFSVNSSKSSYDGDDLRELIRAVSARSLGSTSTGRAEMDLYLQHQMRRSSTAAAAKVVPRSCSVGMGRIDEDGPCEFGEESFGGRAELVYPRSRSYAVAAFKSPLICEPNPIPLLNWNFPLPGEVKLNTDGCWFDHDVEPKAGIGGAFRDSMGAWILGFYGKIASQTSLEAELWAIYRGLTIILEKDIALVKMETDSLMAVRLLHGENAKFHKYAGLIEDLKALMTRTGTTISHIPRLANQSADSLSRIGAEQEERLVVTYDIPEAIRPLIREDIMGAGRLQD